MTKKMKMGIQCRVMNSEYHLHVQGIGPIEANRPYGGAWELRAPAKVIEWCNEQSPVYCSAASGKTYYVQMQVLLFDSGKQALLIHGKEFNHPEGLMMGCNPKSPSVKAVVEYAYQIDMLTDAVFNDKVNEITLVQSPMVLEGEETEAVSGVEEVMSDFEGIMSDFLTKVSVTECKVCGKDPAEITDGDTILVCQGCASPVCDGCYFTPQDCEHCDEETHGGAMVWCQACALDEEGYHLQVDCEEYCSLGGCLIPKPCNCTQVLEEE